MDVAALIQLALQLVATATQLVPQIEANIAQAKAIEGETDLSAVTAQIAQLHSDTLGLTAQIDALR